MLLKCCTQYEFGKFSSGHKAGKGQFSFQYPYKMMLSLSKLPQIALISHASKVMLKILQARLKQYMNWELSDIQLDLEKAEESEVKLPTYTGL